MNRTAYGLDTPRELNWRRFGRCAQPGVDPDLWTVDNALKVAQALHQCRHHCPVAAQCHRDARSTPRDRRQSVVLGGVFYNQSGHPSAWRQVAVSCGLCKGVGRG